MLCQNTLEPPPRNGWLMIQDQKVQLSPLNFSSLTANCKQLLFFFFRWTWGRLKELLGRCSECHAQALTLWLCTLRIEETQFGHWLTGLMMKRNVLELTWPNRSSRGKLTVQHHHLQTLFPSKTTAKTKVPLQHSPSLSVCTPRHLKLGIFHSLLASPPDPCH